MFFIRISKNSTTLAIHRFSRVPLDSLKFGAVFSHLGIPERFGGIVCLQFLDMCSKLARNSQYVLGYFVSFQFRAPREVRQTRSHNCWGYEVVCLISLGPFEEVLKFRALLGNKSSNWTKKTGRAPMGPKGVLVGYQFLYFSELPLNKEVLGIR